MTRKAWDEQVELRTQRETYNGFGETLARAVELVVTPLLFGFGGHLLDDRLDTGAVFTAVLAALALAGTVIRMYYGYVEEMKTHESRLLPGARAPENTR